MPSNSAVASIAFCGSQPPHCSWARHRMGITADGKFSWVEVECLGACVNAPMVQINADYYEDLTPETMTRILNDLSLGRTPKPGPQVDRLNSAPIGGQTTLLDKA